MRLSLTFIALFYLCAWGLSAQVNLYNLSKDSLVNLHASHRRVYQTTRTVNRPKTDGKLDDSCWMSEGEWQGGFVQQVPHQGKKPSQETEVKILYDDNNLYVAIRCYDDEPGKISPIMGRRDDFTSGDVAGIAFDTYYDRQTAFEFNITAAGQKIDLMHIGAYRWDTNWNAVWEGKAALEDSGWCAEFEIPFSQLRFDEKEKQVWGMHIWRWIDRLDEEDQWKLIPIDAPAMVYIFGELHGIENVARKRHIEILPFTAARYLKGDKTDRFGYGVDGKIGITSNFTLDYTIFPDFGQVEADPSELNLTAYEVFYDEKRPFFNEGNSILDYSIGNDLLFYSRRIGHAPAYKARGGVEESVRQPGGTTILNAVKLTGKNKKGLSVGIVNSMTSKEFADISSPDASRREAVEPFTNYFVSRISQDFNNRNTVLGGMVTSTIRSIRDDHLDFLPQSAHVGGIDLLHQWNKKAYYVDAKGFFSQIAGSETAIIRLQRSTQHLFQRSNADHLGVDSSLTVLSGWGGQIKGGKQSGNFRVNGTLNWRSPGVDLNDLGYQKEADFINQRLNFRYQVNKPGGIMRSWYVTLEQRHDWTFGGENINDHLNLHGYIKFKNLWSLHLDGVRNLGKYDTRQLRGGPSLKMDPYSSTEFFLQTNSADKIFIGAGIYRKWIDHQSSYLNDFTFYLQWKISNRFSVTSNNSYEKLTDESQYVTQVRLTTDTRYIVGKIHRQTLMSTLRAEYFITPELSLQYYGSPYASTGHFPILRKVGQSDAKDFGSRFDPLWIIGADPNKMLLDENNDGNYDLAIANPDFNFREFRSNFVLRWEYKAGSTFYFVWSHNRSDYEYGNHPSILKSFGSIPNVPAQNIFMVKLSYWLSL